MLSWLWNNEKPIKTKIHTFSEVVTKVVGLLDENPENWNRFYPSISDPYNRIHWTIEHWKHEPSGIVIRCTSYGYPDAHFKLFFDEHLVNPPYEIQYEENKYFSKAFVKMTKHWSAKTLKLYYSKKEQEQREAAESILKRINWVVAERS